MNLGIGANLSKWDLCADADSHNFCKRGWVNTRYIGIL